VVFAEPFSHGTGTNGQWERKGENIMSPLQAKIRDNSKYYVIIVDD